MITRKMKLYILKMFFWKLQILINKGEFTFGTIISMLLSLEDHLHTTQSQDNLIKAFHYTLDNASTEDYIILNKCKGCLLDRSFNTTRINSFSILTKNSTFKIL